MFYLDPTNDLVFKKLFGTETNKDLLISFLNAILNRKGDKIITEVDFKDPHNHMPSAQLKLSVVDVRCTDKAGNTYIVEMQVNPQHDFLARCHYYTACGLSLQLKKRDVYAKLSPVIFIGITNFALFDDHERYMSHYYLLDSVDHICRLHHEEYHFIELKKFKKTIEELQDISDKWIYFLQNAESCEVPPKQLQKTEPLVKAFNALERGRWTKKELIKYEKLIDKERVDESVMETAKMDGRAQGLKEGRVEGRAEGRAEGRVEGRAEGRVEGLKEARIEMIKNLLAQNVSVEAVCKASGLSKKEIEALIEVEKI